MIYQCPRSATVVANNYCTLAVLNYENFKDLVNRSPLYLKGLKEQIYAYDDPVKLFLEEYLKKVPFLEQMNEDTFHEVLFNFKQDTFDKGATIFKVGEEATSMFVVKSGIIEVTVKIEGSEIAIERLYRGSIINHNAFLIADYVDVSGRCLDTLTLVHISRHLISEIRMRHPNLSLEIDRLKKTYSTKIPLIVDFITGAGIV